MYKNWYKLMSTSANCLYNSRFSTSLVPETRRLPSKYYYFAYLTPHPELRRRRKHRYTTAIKSSDVSIKRRLAIRQKVAQRALVFSAKSGLVEVKPTLLSGSGFSSTCIKQRAGDQALAGTPSILLVHVSAQKRSRRSVSLSSEGRKTETRARSGTGRKKGPVGYTVAACSRPTREECVNGTPYK